MKVSDKTHEPLTGFPAYPLAEMQARAADYHQSLLSRRSIRSFASTPVPRDVIESCISAAGTAPSGANHQPWFFSCVGSFEKKREIRIAAEAEERAFYGGRAPEDWLKALAPIGTDADKPYMEKAPWLICIFAQPTGGETTGQAKKNYYIRESVGIATGLLISACHTAGLATLVHTPNPMRFLNTVCGRPASEKPFLILVTGFPAADAMVPRHALIKKPLKDISNFI